MSRTATIVACPKCRRALSRPQDAIGRVVRCPVCLAAFNSDKAPNWEPPPPRRSESSTRGSAGTVLAQSLEVLTASAAPSFAVGRAGSPEWTEFCPLCESAVPPYRNECPNCQAEFLPLEEVRDRPWEAAGAERRDSEPHRGGFLLTLSIVSCVIPSVSCFLCILGVALNLVGLALGGAAVSLGLRDLRKIRQGTMHGGGRSSVKAATVVGIIGVILNVVTMIPQFVMLVGILF
ncbi:MAG: hypothetical protein N2039_04770 [Gemmataceae bacterium]|nr:hypothetical protein [Gemmataceae bacterium]